MAFRKYRNFNPLSEVKPFLGGMIKSLKFNPKFNNVNDIIRKRRKREMTILSFYLFSGQRKPFLFIHETCGKVRGWDFAGENVSTKQFIFDG